jgi:hypothetical protein
VKQEEAQWLAIVDEATFWQQSNNGVGWGDEDVREAFCDFMINRQRSELDIPSLAGTKGVPDSQSKDLV